MLNRIKLHKKPGLEQAFNENFFLQFTSTARLTQKDSDFYGFMINSPSIVK